MGRPTEHELEQALTTAAKMRETGQDPAFVAKSLLNLHYRVQKLERVMTACRRYLHAGQSASDHRHLMLLLQETERAIGPVEVTDDIPLLDKEI